MASEAEMKLFAYVFGVTFVAELPDKTAFASLVMATKNHPGAIFAGAALAFALHAFLSVALGSVLGLLPEQPIAVGSGVLFILLAILMWLRKESHDEGENLHKTQGKFLKTAGIAFGVIFLAEFGDLTQFSTAALAAKYHHPVLVFAASTLGLWTVTALAVAIGNRAGKILRPTLLKRIAAAVFLLIGFGLLIRASGMWTPPV
jgi:putative Ca2+/H+ antiporter (TMEM165/GDT1 family)